MRVSYVVVAIVGFSLSIMPAAADTTQPQTWIPLFNGKDLDGWTPKIKGSDLGVNANDTFRVQDGAIQVRYDKYAKFDGEFGHLFYKDKFSHYRLRLEYRFTGEQVPGGPGWALRNSGVMIHSQDPATMAKDQDFPVSLEAQFLGGNGSKDRTTGNLCTPGTIVTLKGEPLKVHCTNSSSETYHGDQWVIAELEVNGAGTIRHLIDGKVVLEYEKPELDPGDNNAKKLIKDGKLELAEGYISLQAESSPVEFRKIEILPLQEKR